VYAAPDALWNELLGAITIEKPKNEPASAAQDKLLAHLASQAGLVLRNVRLTAELQATIDDLRASRRRLVKAQDEERQRIERNRTTAPSNRSSRS
jgi:transcriptional regulator with GAF, ATPase, and Fis domain